LLNSLKIYKAKKVRASLNALKISPVKIQAYFIRQAHNYNTHLIVFEADSRPSNIGNSLPSSTKMLMAASNKNESKT